MESLLSLKEFPLQHTESSGFGLWPVLIGFCQCSYTVLPTHLVPTGEMLCANYSLENITPHLLSTFCKIFSGCVFSCLFSGRRLTKDVVLHIIYHLLVSGQHLHTFLETWPLPSQFNRVQAQRLQDQHGWNGFLYAAPHYRKHIFCHKSSDWRRFEDFMPDIFSSIHWKGKAVDQLRLGQHYWFCFLRDRASVHLSAVILCLLGTLQMRSVIWARVAQCTWNK